MIATDLAFKLEANNGIWSAGPRTVWTLRHKPPPQSRDGRTKAREDVTATAAKVSDGSRHDGNGSKGGVVNQEPQMHKHLRPQGA
jgi:hypothetical protein